MSTMTLVGRKEIQVIDAVSGLYTESSIPKVERRAALERIHDDVDARVEALDAQIALEQGEAQPEGERHRFKKE